MKHTDMVKSRYETFANHECKGYSDSYYKMSVAIAADPWLVEFIVGMPETQPNLFLASIQFLAGLEQMPQSASDIRAFVQSHREDITRLMHDRRTQTNEPARCTCILPALPAGPLALIEVGASAGLCLLMDDYAYDYGDQQLGHNESMPPLKCRATGDPPIPKTIPDIVWRCGLDLNPLDIDDPLDAGWLMSLVWPEHPDRRARLANAINVAKQKKVELRRGNLGTDLPSVLNDAPDDTTLVVFHTAVLVYASIEERQAFVAALAAKSYERDVVWISNESPGVVPEFTASVPPAQPSRNLLGRTRLHQGERHDELLGTTHPHGDELEWLAK